jgi:hypothetical protein
MYGVAQAGGAAGTGTSAAWCLGPLPDLFPDRPVWLGAPPPASAGALRPLRVSVRGGAADAGVGLLDQLPNGADRPGGHVRTGGTRRLLLSAQGRAVLFAQAGGQYRAFSWPAGRAPAAVTVGLTSGGVRLSVPATQWACDAPPLLDHVVKHFTKHFVL